MVALRAEKRNDEPMRAVGVLDWGFGYFDVLNLGVLGGSIHLR